MELFTSAGSGATSRGMGAIMSSSVSINTDLDLTNQTLEGNLLTGCAQSDPDLGTLERGNLVGCLCLPCVLSDSL